MIETLQQFEKIEILVNEDPDYLTDEELEQLKIAEEEFKKKETISFIAVKEKWLQGKPLNV